MNWDPALLEPSHLAMWRIIIGWLIGLPVMFGIFFFFALTATVSIEMVEASMRREIEEAGPIKSFMLSVFVAPLLAIAMQILLCMCILAVFSNNRVRS